jgi:hypothetical protein
MDVDVASILKAIGPGASIIFAAWIFMGFVQQRYDAAVDRYRSMIGSYRSGEVSDTRRVNMRDQISVVKRRCELMHYANVTGLIAAIFFVLTLISAALGMVFTKASLLVYVSVLAMLAGFALVVIAAFCVLIESSIVRRQLVGELLDVPDLADSTGQEAGEIQKHDPHPDLGVRVSNALFKRRGSGSR